MKFGKSLSNQIDETLPEWRDKFLSYKELKKKLKVIVPRDGERPSKRPRVDRGDVTGDGLAKEEVEFIQLLEDDLEKFNSFFVEKEEEYIIRLKELQDRVAISMGSNEEMVKIRREIVDFHGEMVLLENYSALNYTGLVKILKKYDKRTGALIRLPYIQKVLQQPFFCTDLLYKLVNECETMLDDRLFPKIEAPEVSSASDNLVNGNNGGPCKELAEIEHIESMFMKSSISALRALQEIRSKSSTVSAFSLPPIQVSELEETWKKIPVFQQVAD